MFVLPKGHSQAWPQRRPGDHRARSGAAVNAALAVLTIAIAACASGRTVISFAEAGFEEEDDLPPPPLVRGAAANASEAPEIAASPEAARLDAALARFAAACRRLRAAAGSRPTLPREGQSAWTDLFAELDAFLAAPPHQVPVLSLVRAQVTLDTELELDSRQYNEMPESVAAGVAERRGILLARMPLARRLARAARPRAMAWPVFPPLVTSLFGDRVDPFEGEWRVHRGIDIAGDSGQLVTAADDGLVVRTMRSGGHGLNVEVEHFGGELSRYSHLSLVLTTVGTRLSKGDAVGLMGKTGRATGPHLHFEVWRHGRLVDPLTVLGGGWAAQGQTPRPPRSGPTGVGG